MVIANPPVMTLESLLVQVAAELQIPKSLDDEVRQHYTALATHLANGSLACFSPTLYAQGSFSLGTVTKPYMKEEFDLDFICLLLLSSSTSPELVFDLVANAIESHGTYKDKCERMKRCIRVHFARDCHVDIVPAVPVEGHFEAIYIPARDDDEWSWHATNPKGYIRWFQSLGQIGMLEKAASIEPLPVAQPFVTKEMIQVGVQLLKRNHQVVVCEDVSLRTPSIVLTTITGYEAAGFGSIVSLMSCVAGTIGERYAATATPRHIVHPAYSHEVISEKWDNQPVYDQFREYTNTLKQQWMAVLATEGHGFEPMVSALFTMFGEMPVNAAIRTLSERVQHRADDRAIKTAAGGGLVVTDPGRGNPRKTFYGDE